MSSPLQVCVEPFVKQLMETYPQLRGVNIIFDWDDANSEDLPGGMTGLRNVDAVSVLTNAIAVNLYVQQQLQNLLQASTPLAATSNLESKEDLNGQEI